MTDKIWMPTVKVVKCPRCGKKVPKLPDGSPVGHEPCEMTSLSDLTPRLQEIAQRFKDWRENCAAENGDLDLVAIFNLHAPDDVAWLLEALREAARRVTQLEQERDDYKKALTNHLCPADAGDWVACAGHPESECDVCNERGPHWHQMEALKARADAAEARIAGLKEGEGK